MQINDARKRQNLVAEIRKIEAERKLERVDQNLLRLSDIVEEVEGRLRSIRAQASKARRYREYSDRLQQLRTFVGWTDWRRLSERIETLDESMRGVRDEAKQLRKQDEQDEQRAVSWEQNYIDFAYCPPQARKFLG